MIRMQQVFLLISADMLFQLWIQMRGNILGAKQINIFFFLAGPAPFSYVSIAKQRAKPHRVKKQFSTSWQVYKCMVANVGGEKEEVGVDKGVKDTVVAAVE